MNTTLGDGDPFSVMMDHPQHSQQPYNNNNNNNNTTDYYTGNNNNNNNSNVLTKLSHLLEKKGRTQDINLIGKYARTAGFCI